MPGPNKKQIVIEYDREREWDAISLPIALKDYVRRKENIPYELVSQCLSMFEITKGLGHGREEYYSRLKSAKSAAIKRFSKTPGFDFHVKKKRHGAVLTTTVKDIIERAIYELSRAENLNKDSLVKGGKRSVVEKLFRSIDANMKAIDRSGKLLSYYQKTALVGYITFKLGLSSKMISNDEGDPPNSVLSKTVDHYCKRIKGAK